MSVLVQTQKICNSEVEMWSECQVKTPTNNVEKCQVCKKEGLKKSRLEIFF